MNNNFGNNGFGGGQQNGFQQQGQQQNNGFGQQQQQNGFQQQGGFQQQNNFGGGASGSMFVDNGAAPDSGRGTLPKGLYPVRITNAEYKENNSHTGWILALENTVIDGVFAGRKIFDNYNLQHQNETTQNIAQSQYAKLCQSIFGNAQNRPNNPAQLIGGEYTIDYGMERKKKQANDAVYGAETTESEEPRMQVNDRMPLSAYKPAGQQQQPMTQQGFGQQQINPQQTSQQQQGFANQHNQNMQQQGQQQNGFQQQGQQQQPGFQGNDGSQGQQQAGFSGQQNGDVQHAQGQGQNGNGQGAGAPQNNQPANNTAGNVNPFNNGGNNGFGGGFGSM